VSNVVNKLAKQAPKELQMHQSDRDLLKWFTNSPQYIAWSLSKSTAILWHCQRSDLSDTNLQFLLANKLQHWGEENRTSDVAYYFCARSETLVAPPLVLRSLIGQLLNDNLNWIYAGFVESKKRLDSLYRGMLDEPTPSQEHMWDLLQSVLQFRPTRDIFLFIGNIDAISREDLQTFVKGLQKFRDAFPTFVKGLKKFRDPFLRIFVTSLPRDDIASLLRGSLKIDENSECIGPCVYCFQRDRSLHGLEQTALIH
jgi:hypothetical protein